jgi:hypothetical protein
MFVLIFAIGLIPLAHFVPPPSPRASAETITAMYLRNLTGIRFGMFLDIIAAGLLAPWGALIAERTRKIERGVPVLTCGQLACVGVSTFVAAFIPFI